MSKEENKKDNIDQPKKSDESALIEPPDKRPISIPADEIISSIVGMVHQVGFEANCSVRKAKTLPFAFVLHQEAIGKIEQYATERMAVLKTIPPDSITFEGTVGYADMTVRAFPSLHELLKHAGDKKSPTNLTLRWRALLAEPQLMMAIVEIKFHTDVRKETESLELLHFPIAHIEYEVGGVNNDWVEGTAEDIEPILKSIRLRGLYKPLLIFRNRALVHIVSWSLAILAQITTIQAVSRLFRSESKSDILSKIINSASITDKFDQYVKYRMSDTSLFEPILVVGSGLILMIIVVVAGFHFLPMLVPRSGILIGLEKNRYQVYENVFKFIVFTLLFGGLGIAILMEILKIIF